MPNPYYIAPLGGLNVGKVAQETESVFAQRKLERAKEDLRSAIESDDTNKIADVMMQYPELGEYTQKVIGFRNELTKQDAIDRARDVLIKGKDLTTSLEERRQTITEQGGNPAHTDDLLNMAKENPDLAYEEAERTLALLDPQGYKQYSKLMGLDTSDNEATPTDIDDFVRDANEEAIRTTGRPLTPGERNKARMKFKRAQAPEVYANKFAQRSAEAETAETIGYNSELGTQLAKIETAADLIKAKGELTPVEQQTAAKKRMSGNLASLTRHFLKLDSLKAIINTDSSTMENILAAAKSSSVGQAFGRVTGSNAQSVRNSIKKLKPLLIQDIRAATQMGVRGMDSAKELEFYLQAATDEKTDIQSNLAAIAVLDMAYGDGSIKDTMVEKLDPSLIDRLAEDGFSVLWKLDVPASELSTDELLKRAEAQTVLDELGPVGALEEMKRRSQK